MWVVIATIPLSVNLIAMRLLRGLEREENSRKGNLEKKILLTKSWLRQIT